LTSSPAVLQRQSMEPPKHRCDTQVCTSPAGTSGPSSTAFVVETRIQNWATFADPEATEMGGDRLRPPSSRTAGLKPIADGTRRMPPFGSPKGAGRHQQTRRSTGGIARNQVDPPRGGTGARVQRHRCLRNRWPHRPPFDRQPRLREGRLTGFPGSLAEVLRHRVGGRGGRVLDAVSTGSFGAANVGEPAYPRYNRGAGEGRCPFDPRQTRAPVDCAGGGVAPLPPVAARPVG